MARTVIGSRSFSQQISCATAARADLRPALFPYIATLPASSCWRDRDTMNNRASCSPRPMTDHATRSSSTRARGRCWRKRISSHRRRRRWRVLERWSRRLRVRARAVVFYDLGVPGFDASRGLPQRRTVERKSSAARLATSTNTKPSTGLASRDGREGNRGRPLGAEDAAGDVGVPDVPRRGSRPADARLPGRARPRLGYQLRCIEDLHAMLDRARRLDAARRGRRAEAGDGGHGRGVGPLAVQPGRRLVRLKKGLRGRFGMYVPPLLEALGLAELEHDPRNNRMRAL